MSTLLVAKESVSTTEPITPGQLAVPLDTSLGDRWQVRLLSGPSAGQEVCVHRESVEEHNSECSILCQQHTVQPPAPLLSSSRVLATHQPHSQLKEGGQQVGETISV